MSFSSFVSKYHDQLKLAMLPYRGSLLTNAEISKILVRAYPQLDKPKGWILPSDHCINHTCKGACRCTLTDDAAFERIGRGKYLVR